MKISLAISAVLHTLLILALVLTSEVEDKEKKDDPVKVEIRVESQKDTSIIPKSLDKGSGKECEDYYGGIGVHTVGPDLEGYLLVTQVIRGYPADLAGIQEGELVKNANGGDVRGKPGTEVKLKVRAGGTVITKSVIRDKICTKGQDNG